MNVGNLMDGQKRRLWKNYIKENSIGCRIIFAMKLGINLFHLEPYVEVSPAALDVCIKSDDLHEILWQTFVNTVDHHDHIQ